VNEAAEFLCAARRDGVRFDRLLTLGRQQLYVSRSRLLRLARQMDLPASVATSSQGEFAEAFFRGFLGATDVVSLDASAFQGADLAHDLNTPTPREWDESFDAVLDAGTLEHIFNFPVALASCMRAVRVGGALFVMTPANNQFGHGFYQFSPELFFRALSPEHGFQIEEMLAVEFQHLAAERGARLPMYRVGDPATVGSRVSLVNSRPVLLMVRARKLRHEPDPFGIPPQQSDYARAWQQAGAVRRRSWKAALAVLVPPPIRRFLLDSIDKHYTHTFRNRRIFRPVK